ncbi:MAG: CHAP domain-containing protein [Nanoarchaeota archaeon]
MNIQKLFEQFLKEFNNKYVEMYSLENLNKCFDLVSKWIAYMGYPRLTAGLLNAYEIYAPSTQLLRDNFDYIKNTPEAIPQVGDIVVFSKEYNKTAGHTAIATGGGNLKTFTTFSQNDPLKSNSHLVTYNYKYVIGWLRSRKTDFEGKEANTALEECLSQHNALVQQALDKDIFIKSLQEADTKSKLQLNSQQSEIERLRTTIDNQQKNIEDRNNDIVKLNSDISTLKTTLTNKDSQIATLTEQVNKTTQLITLNNELETQRETWFAQEKSYNAQIGQLKNAIPHNKYLLWLYNAIINLDRSLK